MLDRGVLALLVPFLGLRRHTPGFLHQIDHIPLVIQDALHMRLTELSWKEIPCLILSKDANDAALLYFPHCHRL